MHLIETIIIIPNFIFRALSSPKIIISFLTSSKKSRYLDHNYKIEIFATLAKKKKKKYFKQLKFEVHGKKDDLHINHCISSNNLSTWIRKSFI
jgi:hypothetical protein